MRRIEGYVKTRIYGSTCYFDLEVEDDATEKEIEDEVMEAMWDEIEVGWEEKED